MRVTTEDGVVYTPDEPREEMIVFADREGGRVSAPAFTVTRTDPGGATRTLTYADAWREIWGTDPPPHIYD